MAILSKSEIETLAKANEPTCISIYMPTYRAGQETQQNSIRYKALLRKAEELLVQQGMRPPEAKEHLERAAALLNAPEWTQSQSDGLAVFVSPHEFHSYRLPFRFDELVIANTRFYIKPLVPLLTGDGRFFVLALSQSQVRLLQGTRYSVDEINVDEIPGMPKSLKEAFKNEEDQQQRNLHSFPSGEATGKFGQTTIYHGQGGTSEDDDKTYIRRFFQMVDNALHNVLRNEQAPLVLAGVEYLLPIYREVNTYQHLTDEAIEGNPNDLPREQLHARAWKILQPMFEGPQKKAVEAVKQLAGEKSKRVSDDLRQIVPAAFYGRVGTLLIQPNAQLWGKFDPNTDNIQLHAQREKGDEDLYDLAVVQTFLNNGDIFMYPADQMPNHKPAAAVFRY